MLVHTENEQDRQFSIIPLHAVVDCERGVKSTQLPGDTHMPPTCVSNSHATRADWFVAQCSPTQKTIDNDAVDKRRRQLVEILNKHRLKFKIDDTDKTVSVLDGAAKIRAPYTVDDCHCDNAIVMRRVTELIKTIEQ